MKYILLLLAICSSAHAQSLQDQILLPQKNKDSTFLSTSPDSDMQWNRYSTDNFVILSISDKQGRWLYNNLEQIKYWCLSRWGISNYKLKNECRIMVVPNKDLFKKFFNLDKFHLEFRKNGDSTITAIWLFLEEGNEEQIFNDLPKIISEACFKEIIKNKKFLEVGVSLLNESPNKIKNNLKDIKEINMDFFKKSLEDYEKFNNLQKSDFEKNSLLFCLMLKKEFGESKFLKLLLSDEKDALKNINKIYQFNDGELEHTFNRYFDDLKNAFKKDEVPNKYLKIERGKL